MPSSTNITGSNPGPNIDTLPDLTQTPYGAVRQVSTFSISLTPVSVAANTTAEQAFTVNGLQVGDFAEANMTTFQAGLSIANSRVSAANTLAIAFGNNTASPIVPTAGPYTVLMVRPLPATPNIPVGT